VTGASRRADPACPPLRRAARRGAAGCRRRTSTTLPAIPSAATRERDHAIAAALDALIEEARNKITI